MLEPLTDLLKDLAGNFRELVGLLMGKTGKSLQLAGILLTFLDQCVQKGDFLSYTS